MLCALPLFTLASVAAGLAAHGAQPKHGQAKHHVLVGNFGSEYNVTLMLDGTQDVGLGFLYALEIDTEKKSLELVKTSPAAAAHPWLSVNRKAGVVYGSGWSKPVNGTRTFSSYAIQPDYSVSLLNTVVSCGTKPIANDFVPEAGEHGVLYGLDFVNPCGEAWAVSKNGALERQVQALGFEEGSTLHGFVTTPDLKYMYIMNLGGNNVHGYSLFLSNGTLSSLALYPPSEVAAGPRHAVISPSGAYLYLIDEEGLRVDQFAISQSRGALEFTSVSLAVTPFGLAPANASLYWGDEIVISSDGRTLYASTRSRVAGPTTPGYISGWALDATGALVSQDPLFVKGTPGAGGTSNILSVSPWGDASKDMLVLTDQDQDFVALYELQGRELVLLDRVKYVAVFLSPLADPAAYRSFVVSRASTAVRGQCGWIDLQRCTRVEVKTMTGCVAFRMPPGSRMLDSKKSRKATAITALVLSPAL
ncbi:3-carboxy-cis,cis-mucoante lactonizing enzyme [Mycena indigotica]|uniref:3-carboxy-cis,cis-mucoante lactonizing enzyme n=1 Tax=Mycena indigotica TaxID=2126181 RepID=A0A8H6SDN4_9AGAR|nr:3-carboxy-cis,cis-mucoante lactonizing enzyme [Mycena indigotica]KAF7296835.1 3-carboxy-cis,cis-mucoante lactonizing enzyme [Mycena indigotica]